MGFYSHRILPRLLNWGMNQESFNRLRRRYLAGVSGDVLEVGFGSGLNLPAYPPGLRRLIALEPSALGRRLSQGRVAAAPFPVEFVGLSGEQIPLPDAAVDAVVTTWTLCTIPDAPRALAEMRRVLRPGGSYHFVEHGLSTEAAVARWQHRLTPIQRLLGGGCHLDRPIDRLILDAGFTFSSIDTFYIRGPRIGTWTYVGVALPS